jgi:VanZ family protein
MQAQPVNELFAALEVRKRTKSLCLVAVVAVLIATLWPFNPFPRNGVTWLRGTTGLRFEKAGLVVSNVPLRLAETGSCSLELLLRPASTESAYTILAFYARTRTRQFMVRQWTDGLIVTHDATVDSDKTRTIKFDVDHVFRPGKLVLVTISSGPNGTAVYLDGQPAEAFAGFSISRSELSGEIVLGTSPVTYDPWPGELRGLAIYSKDLTPASAFQHYEQWTSPIRTPPDLDGAIARYVFAEASGREVHNEVTSGPNLEMPVTFSVPHKSLLQSVAKEFSADWTYAIDLLQNIAGFVPLGLIVCAYFGWTRSRWKAILIATVTCGILSFVIEVLQYYIPRRGSGTTDIITNTAGAALGAVLTQAGPFRRLLLRVKLIS